MSPPSERFQVSVQPFPRNSNRGEMCAVIFGCAVAGIVWVLFRGNSAFPKTLAFAPLLVSHALAGAIIFWGSAELIVLFRKRRELMEIIRHPETPALDVIWNQAVYECRNADGRYGDIELLGIINQVGDQWSVDLGLRYCWALMLSLLLVFPGLLQGLHELRLSAPGQYLEGFSDVFIPLIVASLEGLVCGFLVWGCRICWGQTIQQWKETTSKAIRIDIQKKRESEQKHSLAKNDRDNNGKGREHSGGAERGAGDDGGKGEEGNPEDKPSDDAAKKSSSGWNIREGSVGTELKSNLEKE